MAKTDVVYVLGTGSNWNNNEIRFSLRSLEKNLGNMGNVYVVGEDPEFLKNIIHIPYPDVYGPKNADGNIIEKVLRVCKEKGLSNQFLFINDDHLVLQPIDADKVPYFHKGDMTTFAPKYWQLNYWRKRLKRTMEVLVSKKLTALHFDCHTPILFDKKLFPPVVGEFDYGVDIGYTMKSIYGNAVVDNPVLLTDQKVTVFKNYTFEEINQRLSNCTFFSFNDGGLNKPLKFWLVERFPEMSQFEKTDISDRYVSIYKALMSPDDKELIRATFIKYGREAQLVRTVQQHYTPQLHNKVLFKLKRYCNG